MILTELFRKSFRGSFCCPETNCEKNILHTISEKKKLVALQHKNNTSKNKSKRRVTIMKKKNILTKKRMLAAALSLMLVAGLAGCGSKEPEKKEEKPTVKTETKAAFTEKDIQDVVAGITDHYVLQDAKGIDYLHNVSYDKTIVKEVTADAKDVKVDKLGVYKATYTVTVDKEALTSYLEEKKAKDDAKKDLADTAKDTETKDNATTPGTDAKDNATKEEADVSKPNENTNETSDDKAPAEDSATDKTTEDTNTDSEEKAPASGKDEKEDVKVEVDTDITIVDKEEAEELANKGEVVWGDNNEPVAKEDGTAVEEEVEAPESNPESAAKPDNQQASKPNSNTGNTSKPSKPSGNSGGNSKPSKPSHTHNYNIPITKTVKHDATGHYENKWVQDSAAWDEPIYANRTICNKCGADITGYAVEHSAECGGGYSVKEVQVGTKHHEATGHNEKVWVQDKAAWTETVTTGYKCSCGATR